MKRILEDVHDPGELCSANCGLYKVQLGSARELNSRYHRQLLKIFVQKVCRGKEKCCSMP